MKVISYILGALLVVLGIVCLFNPGSTLLATGYVMAILLLIFGIVGIINVIMRKTPPISLLASIPAFIIGIIAIINPGTTLVFDAFMIYLFAAWFIVQGITSIIMSIQGRHEISGWGFILVLGIISMILGIYAFVYPLVSIVAIGILIGIFFIETGITLITLTATIGSAGEMFNQAKNKFTGNTNSDNNEETDA